MKKTRKPFKVEVKRKPSKSSGGFAQAIEKLERSAAASQRASVKTAKSKSFGSPVSPAKASLSEASALEENGKAGGRVLKCLVSEAALETAQEKVLEDALKAREAEERPVGRPRKSAEPLDLETVAPQARRRGRPRKDASQKASVKPAGSKKAAAKDAAHKNAAHKNADAKKKNVKPFYFEDEDASFATAPAKASSGQSRVVSSSDRPHSSSTPLESPSRRKLIDNQEKIWPRGQRWKRRLPPVLW